MVEHVSHVLARLMTELGARHAAATALPEGQGARPMNMLGEQVSDALPSIGARDACVGAGSDKQPPQLRGPNNQARPGRIHILQSSR